MLPIVNQPVEGARVSIYNEAVQAKFPLLGLRFKNTTGQNLMQGPVTVYEGGTYAGDARIMDLQPNEERLLGFAIDQGTEVKCEIKRQPEQLIAVKVVKGVMQVTHKLRETKKYIIKNRSPQDRDLIIEHPIRDDWKLVTPEKPARSAVTFTASSARWRPARRPSWKWSRSGAGRRWPPSARRTTRWSSVPERQRGQRQGEGGADEGRRLRRNWRRRRRDLAQLNKQLKAITDDQMRLRANLGGCRRPRPPTSAI